MCSINSGIYGAAATVTWWLLVGIFREADHAVTSDKASCISKISARVGGSSSCLSALDGYVTV